MMGKVIPDNRQGHLMVTYTLCDIIQIKTAVSAETSGFKQKQWDSV